MPLKDWLAAVAVIVAWGLNFVVIKLGLHELPPFLMGGLRFSLVVLAVFFVKRPAVSWTMLAMYGVTISLGQFAFTFTAMAIGMPAGLASLVVQAQAFFTVLISAMLLGERIRRHHVLGMAIAAVGLVLIQQGQESVSVPVLGFVLTLCAALSWACGNIVVKRIGKVDMMGLVIWGALIPPIPFFILSWLFEGREQIEYSLAHISFVGVGALVYLALLGTVMGYVLWGRLLTRHPVAKVAPLSLLVPVVGLIAATVFVDEHLAFIQWVGGLVVLLGLIVNVFGMQFVARLKAMRG